MKNRGTIYLVLIVALFLCVSTTGVYAYGGDKPGKGCHGKCSGHHWDLESKFMNKVSLIIRNGDELGLSDDQKAKIKALKLSAKKHLISKKADIEIIGLDIKALMWEDTINTEEINKLIDKKYELKKEKAKALIGAYAALKGTLTKEQMEKLKELYKGRKKDK